MALLWENLAQQLSSVRASIPVASTEASPAPQGSGDDPSNRRRRLEAALKAIQDSVVMQLSQKDLTRYLEKRHERQAIVFFFYIFINRHAMPKASRS